MTLMDEIARGEVLLLDGAMGTELERRGVPMHHQAWSGLSMLEQQASVRAVHADYLAAGARIHIVNSFALARHVLQPAGLGDQVATLNRRAVELCREAIEEFDGDGPQWIAGSLSTFAAQSDRSRLPVYDRLKANYDEQASILTEAGVELLALEMLCDVEISHAALAATADCGLPIMLGFTCIWGEDGETVEMRARAIGLPGARLEVVLPEVLANLPDGCQAILALMHSDLDVTERALDIALDLWEGPLAVYPNSGSFVYPHWQFEQVCTPDAFTEAAEGWIARGAQIVGGCCGIGPEHIRSLARAREAV